MRSSNRLARPLVALLGLACCTVLASPHAALAEPKRHHITIGLGVQQFVSDDFDNSGFETAGLGEVAYRYSMTPSVDLVFDTRATISSQDVQYDFGGTIYAAQEDYSTTWAGPGVRLSGTGESARPYVQANLFFVDENLNVDLGSIEVRSSDNGVGFGVQAGVDIRLSRLLTLPIEANLLVGKPENDLTSVGAGIGLTFNFGEMD